MTNKALLITSISNDKNKILKTYSALLPQNFKFIVIGDKKSPKNFHLKNCDFFNIEKQKELKFKITKKLPYNHYARKNIGYLIAMENKCEEVYETDDDNFPYENFFTEKKFIQETNVLENKELINIYSFFTEKNIWPRGFPIEHILNEKYKAPKKLKSKKVFTPILQSLADKNPDVDAIYRLVKKLPVYFKKNESITLLNTYSPFNSQGTIWNKKAFPLLYIPSYCSFRECDIWRGLIAAKICFEFKWGINFFSPCIYQERNEHNLLNDFKQEIGFYLNSGQVIAELKKLKLYKSDSKIFDNLIICYEFFIKKKLIENKELKLLKLWIEDCQTLIK